MSRSTKYVTVPSNGQISIGKAWAGRQILVEETEDGVIHITPGSFVPDSQKTFHTEKAKASLAAFNKWENEQPAKATDTNALFAALKKKKKKK